MKKKIIWLNISLVLLLSMILISCSSESSTTSISTPKSTTTAVLPPATTSTSTAIIIPTTTNTPATTSEPPVAQANWWDGFGIPKYGGKITIPTDLSNVQFDPYTGTQSVTQVGFQFSNETMFWWDWTLDRSVWSFSTEFLPEQYAKGLLAESWEQTDPMTMTVHLRKGIKWQNKAPVNGREFVASDVIEHFNRVMGWGGYTKPNAYQIGYFKGILSSVTAPDNYTVVFKFDKSYVSGMFLMFDLEGKSNIEAPESVKSGNGTITNWKEVVGTGPWIVSDFMSGSTLTFTRNPDYWGKDERYPQNQLPYADTMQLVSIADKTTQVASLRTAKIDMASVSWQQQQTLVNSNPDLIAIKKRMGAYALLMRVDNIPFKDIRVRKALQMSIDRPALAKGVYGGTADPIPVGMVTPSYKGWAYDYSDWPQELKEEYSYNPEKSMALLKEAGFATGFTTNVVSAASEDMNLLQAIKSYFSDIGVNMEIRTMDPPAAFAFVIAGKNDQLYYASQGGASYPPSIMMSFRYSKDPRNFCHNVDPVYDEAFNRFATAATVDQARQALQDGDKRAIEQHWSVYTFPASTYIIHQPYLKGYSGELFSANVVNYGQGGLWARLWISK